MLILYKLIYPQFDFFFKNILHLIMIPCILTSFNNSLPLGPADWGLRFLSDDDINNPKISNIPIIIFAKCESNSDCSNNGVCNKYTGKCHCDFGFDTFLSKNLIEIKTENAFTIIDNMITKNPSSNKNMTDVAVYRVDLTTDDLKYCNYQLKSQLTALMLSIFVGFGSEHFYLERNSTGAAKFVFYVFCCALNIVIFIIYKCFPNKKTFIHHLSIFEVTYLACGFVYIILWNIYDWVHIGYNTFLDGNGFKMIPWN